MARRRSSKTKEKLGTGEGVEYKPYIVTREFNSIGTTSVILDWKTGRGIQCLSQGEAEWYYLLRWNDNNVDIREQFPLETDIVYSICDEFGIKHPSNFGYKMTTDFLVTEKAGNLHAYSVKTSKAKLNNRKKELLFIEKIYWNKKGVEYSLLFKEDVNHILLNNIRMVVEYFNEDTVNDRLSYVKHLLAHKFLQIDLGESVLTREKLMFLYERWAEHESR